MSFYTPQVVPTQRPLVFWAISAALVASLVSLIVVAPLAAASGHGEIAGAIYRGFSVLCHQRPDRSYFIDGHKLGVCSRCTGIYAGFALTLLGYPLIRSLRTTTAPARKWLLLAALPLFIDFSLTFFGIWENTHTSRLLTGLLLGGVAVFYVMPGIVDLSLRPLQITSTKVPTFTLASPESIASAPSDYRRKNAPKI
ncbi:MAG TPA: DUF2085 domain-containing protein [Pyrinomonadaceae bacterium]